MGDVMKRLFGILLLAMALPCVGADGIRMELVEYPFPVKMHKFISQAQELEMAYMDVPALNPAAEVVVLFHGKNFCGASWSETALALRDAGYRVIIPDQIGFGKSSKPDVYQFSFACDGPFDGGHAGDALRIDVSGGDQGPDAGGTPGLGRLSSQRRAVFDD
jgi:pimeloyl-ACP methyl ester carboxylesterase